MKCADPECLCDPVDISGYSNKPGWAPPANESRYYYSPSPFQWTHSENDSHPMPPMWPTCFRPLLQQLCGTPDVRILLIVRRSVERGCAVLPSVRHSPGGGPASSDAALAMDNRDPRCLVGVCRDRIFRRPSERAATGNGRGSAQWRTCGRNGPHVDDTSRAGGPALRSHHART